MTKTQPTQRKAQKHKVVVLGATGMLGSMVAHRLAQAEDIQLTVTTRNGGAWDSLRDHLPGASLRILDAQWTEAAHLEDILTDAEWAINCIGETKPRIACDTNPIHVWRAVEINTVWPHRLAVAAMHKGCRVLQIATDCVFSGERGKYVESDDHDALDVYGKTKSLGETHHPNVYHLRCSIIGPEMRAKPMYLLEWLLGHPTDTLPGYTDHRWNGITTLAFANLCLGVVREGAQGMKHIQHVLPKASLSKYDLLRCCASAYKRSVTVQPSESGGRVDRALATQHRQINTALWKAAGYPSAPTIRKLVAELAEYPYPFRGCVPCE